MATRFYLEYGDATHQGTSVPPDAGWEVVGAVNGRIRKTKTAQALSQTAVGRTVPGLADILIYRGISDPLDVDQTITGSFVGVSRFNESNLAADARTQCQVKVIKPDGTVRGTLVAFDTGGLANEFNAVTNRIFPRGGAAAVTSVAALAGDRLFLEVGARMHHTGSNVYTVSMLVGTSAGSDMVLDEVGTAALDPWIEFSQDITLAGTAYLGRESMDIVTQQSGAGRIGRVAMDVVTQMKGNGQVGRIAMDVLVPNGMPGSDRFVWGTPHAMNPIYNGYSVWIPDSSEFEPWPVGTVEGDRVIIQAENGWNVAVPSGFTQHYFLAAGNGSGGLYSKVMDATDIANGGVLIEATGGSFPGAANLVRISGANGTPSIRTFSGGYAGSALGTFPLASPVAVAGELILWMVCTRGDVGLSCDRGVALGAQAHGSGGASSGVWGERAQAAVAYTGTFVAGGATSNRIPQAVMVTLP